VVGMGAGLLITFWMTRGVRATLPSISGELVASPRLSWRVLVFATMATSACVVLVGLLPAIQISRVDPNELLKSGAGTGAHRKHRRQYGVLVATEIALALGLMSGAGLMVHAALAYEAHAMDVGYDPRKLIEGHAFNAVSADYLRASDLLRAEAERVRDVQGVRDAAATMWG